MRLALRAAIVAAVTTGLYAIADMAVGHFAVPANPDAPRASAFQGEPYASSEFFAEAAREPGEWHKVDWHGLLEPSDYHGLYFNVDRLGPTNNVYRRTINPESGKPKLIVLLLGPSTVYGPAAPDGQTLASLLAARLTELDSTHGYVVYNAGVFGADSRQERSRLAYELDRGLKPDIVISYGGGMDIIDGVYMARPGSAGFFLFAHSGLRGVLPLNIYHWLLSRARAAISRDKRIPPHLLDRARVAELITATAAAWYENELAMAEMSQDRGARFFSILQPTPYSSTFDYSRPDIPYVHDLTDAEMPGLGTVAGGAQQALAKESAALRLQGVSAVDLSSGLRGKVEDVFVDFGHLNAAGHRILANEIAAIVLRRTEGVLLQAGLAP